MLLSWHNQWSWPVQYYALVCTCLWVKMQKVPLQAKARLSHWNNFKVYWCLQVISNDTITKDWVTVGLFLKTLCKILRPSPFWCMDIQIEKSVNFVHSIMLRKMVGVDQQLSTSIKSKFDLARLPPCKDKLVPHIWRSTKQAALPMFWCPSPYDPLKPL